MVYGAILEKGEQWYTSLKRVFDAIGNAQTQYNWLITDFECCPQSPDIGALLSQKYCWLSGHELTSMVHQEDFQWIWAVLSGFRQEIPLDEILKYPFPCSVDHEGFWKNPLTIQHPLAEVEIVPWDSSSTFIYSGRKDIVDSFRKFFPLSEDIASYNQQFTSSQP